MSKLAILALALCLIGSCQATEYLIRSTDGNTVTATNLIDHNTITTTCGDITSGGASGPIYGMITANSANWDVKTNCDDNTCTGTCTTLTALVPDTPTQVSSAGAYYTITTTANALTPTAQHILIYDSSSGCTTATDLVADATVTPLTGCVSNTVDSMTYNKITWSTTDGKWAFLYGCTDNACSAGCLGGNTATAVALSTCTAVGSATIKGQLSTSAGTLTASYSYVAAYSAATVSATNFVSEDKLPKTGACTALTSDSTKYGYARLIGVDTYKIGTLCTTSTCSSCPDTVASLATSASTPVTGTATNYYLVASTRQWYTVVAYSALSCPAANLIAGNFVQATTATTTYAATTNQADVFMNLAFSGSAYTLNYACSSTSVCTSAETISNPTIDGSTCIAGSTGYSFKIYEGKQTITSASLYLNTFSATTANKANYKSQDVLPASGACTALTSTSGKFGKVSYYGTTNKWKVDTLCTTNACSTCTEAIASGVDLSSSASTATQGTTTSNFYTLTTASTGYGNTSTSAATLSVYLFALVALLFAALF